MAIVTKRAVEISTSIQSLQHVRNVMPVFTTLEFFRSKQTISSYDKMYPKSTAGLREAIQNSLDTVNNMLVELKYQYLGRHISHESYIREKAISLYIVLIETEHDGIYRKMDFETLFDKASFSNVLNEHANKIKEIRNHILTYNPNSFIPIVELFEKILSCMEKYFLSFYSGNIHLCPDKHIETPFDYENRRLQIIQDVKKNMRKIFNLSNQFNTHGLKLADMSDYSNHMARISRSTEMPCFLLFPESCNLIEESRQLLLQWIEIDKDYPITIRSDISDMRKDKVKMEIKKRSEHEEYIKHRYAADLLQREYNDMASVRVVMEGRLKRSEQEHHEILVKIKLSEYQIDKIKRIVKELQKKNEGHINDDKLEKEINEQVFLMTKTKKTLKEEDAKLQIAESKIQWYKKFLKTITDKKSALTNALDNCTKYKSTVEEIDDKIEKIDEYAKHLHSICALKSSNSTLKKIFHNLDFKKHLGALPDKYHDKTPPIKDELTNAIEVTSQMIDKDWITLYVNLPFHPPKGTTEIENDIGKFIKNQARGSKEDLALESLNSWKRCHIRANMISLVVTLQNINRLDILKKLNCLPKSKVEETVNRFDEERIPPMSATTRFLIKHYPNLQKSRLNTIE